MIYFHETGVFFTAFHKNLQMPFKYSGFGIYKDTNDVHRWISVNVNIANPY
jgi:hypothetical protein